MRTEEMTEAERQALEQRRRDLDSAAQHDPSSDEVAHDLPGHQDAFKVGKSAVPRHGNTLRDELHALHLGEALYLEAALHRLAVGPFAECIACHKKIDQARLLVNPAAERCKACQQTWEAAASHPGDARS